MYPRYRFGWSDLHAIRSGHMKLIVAPRSELYDLDTDPAERVNLYQQKPEIAGQMALTLRTIESSESLNASAAEAGSIDPETAERLRSLGYVGSTARVTSDQTQLADPKDKLDLYNRITRPRHPGGYQ